MQQVKYLYNSPAVDDSVRVEHGNDFEHKLLS